MSITRCFAIIFASGVALAVGGGSIGYALARVAPSYYRGVFRAGDSTDFDPVQVGLGLGLSQGLVAGLTIGAVVVLAVTLSGLRRPAKNQLQSDDEVGKAPRNGCLFGIISLLIGALISIPIGLLIGALAGEYACKTRRFSDEKAIITPVLASDPALSGLRIEMSTSDGTAVLYGEVATKEDVDRLKSRMRILMGETRLTEIISAVAVRKK